MNVEQHPTDAAGALRLVCTKCTRTDQYVGGTREEAWLRAATAGWRTRPGGVVVCPKCPGGGKR